MAIVPVIQSAVSAQIKKLYQTDIDPSSIPVNETKPEFEGDYTVVLFALVKQLKKQPDALGIAAVHFVPFSYTFRCACT